MTPLYNAFVYMVWFCATYYVVFLLLALIIGKDKLFEKRSLGKWRPSVSVIVPAYNEEKTIAHTIESLQKITYPKVEFIVLSDGSSDGTGDAVRRAIQGDPRFRFVDNTENKGKAATLNQGIDLAQGQFVACMDADSMVEPDVFEKALPYFRGKRVGAVTITVEVAEKKRFLHRIFDIEYIIGLSLFLKVFSFFDSVFVTPGPFSIYRATALRHIGGFDANNITEDLEIAYRLQKAHYRIATCMEAKVRTYIPPTFSGLYKQRRRWYTGALQTLNQHRSMLFDRRYGMFAYVVPINYLIIFLGLALFIAGVYLSLSQVVQFLFNIQYTGFNFLDHITFNIDLLQVGNINMIGITAFLATIVSMFMGLAYANKRFRDRKLGIIGYPLLFFLYQVFWISAVWNAVRGKKVKWK